MSDNERQEDRAQDASSPAQDENVKVEDEGNEDAEGEDDVEAGAAAGERLGRDYYNAMRNVVEIVNTHKITIRGEE